MSLDLILPCLLLLLLPGAATHSTAENCDDEGAPLDCSLYSVCRFKFLRARPLRHSCFNGSGCCFLHRSSISCRRCYELDVMKFHRCLHWLEFGHRKRFQGFERSLSGVPFEGSSALPWQVVLKPVVAEKLKQLNSRGVKARRHESRNFYTRSKRKRYKQIINCGTLWHSAFYQNCRGYSDAAFSQQPRVLSTVVLM